MARMECSFTQTYDVRVLRDLLDPANPALADAAGAPCGLVVLDAGVERAHGPAVTTYLAARMPGFAIHVVGLTERTKTLDSVVAVCAAAQRHSLGRRDALVAIGGGLCCDIVSVAASLIRRGIPYVCVPTTLLGQVDAGIGLKGGVNFAEHKNYLGSFHPPAAVLIDTAFLSSVNRAELRCGLAEIVKMAVVRDGGLLHTLRELGPALVASGFSGPREAGEALVERAVSLMLSELARDPFERGDLRRLVDFGHTFSPLWEELSGYHLPHGEAVSLDMALSAALAAELGLLADLDLLDILTTLDELGLPITSPLATHEHLAQAMSNATRHRDGSLNLVVPTGVGAATFVSAAEDIPAAALVLAARRVQTYAAATGRTPREPALARAGSA